MAVNTTSVFKYLVLYDYAVLAAAGFTSTNDVIVNRGNWDSQPTRGAGYGNVIAGTPPAEADTVNFDQAHNVDLPALKNDLKGLTGPNLVTGYIGGSTQTITPGIYFNSGSTIIFTSGATLTLDGQGDQDSQFIFIAGTSMTFASVTAINLINEAKPYNVFWLADSGAITLTGSAPPSIPGTMIAGTSVTFLGNSTVNNVYAGSGAIDFGAGTIIVNSVAYGVICYAKGTKIATQRKQVPIERLTMDDNIATRGIFEDRNSVLTIETKFRPIKWKSQFTIKDLNVFTKPVCIKKDAFGLQHPFEDLYVSPTHGILLNGKLVEAFKLINGTTIVQEYPYDEVTYYHIELDEHCIISANGILSESYLDDCNRDLFDEVPQQKEPPMYSLFRRTALLK
jgi:hypothetical protein